MKTHYPFSRPAFAAAVLGLATLSAGAAVSAQPQTAPAAPAPKAQVAPEANDDIRDIRGPIHLPSRLPWLIGAASGAALLAGGYGAWRWGWHGRRSLRPFEIALAKLEATRRLMQPETAREFSIAVSEVVRGFIEESFPVRAAHRTTDEFLHALASQADLPLAAHHENFEHFLSLCDLAKFARWQLSEPEMEELLESARVFVRSIGAPTKSASTAPAPAAPAPTTA